MKQFSRRAGMLLVSIGVIATAYSFGRFEERSRSSVAHAESSKQASSKAVARATRALADRDAYFPNTEDLGPDEVRIIACGTGMPSARESQAASCFLVELGNGDKFIFDGGTGSDARIGSLEIPYDLLDKILISHLHTDHWGSFPAYYVGGWVAGRTVPLRVWGPSGCLLYTSPSPRDL